MDQIFLPGERSWIYPPLPIFGRQQQQPEAIAQSCDAVAGIATIASGATNNELEVRRSEPENVEEGTSDGRLRKRKRKDVAMKDDVLVIPAATEPEPSWEEETRASLGLTNDEFSQFVESQGLKEKSADLHSLFDFGVPEPKGMPRFAVKIPDQYYKYSNALRVYRNSLKPYAVDGDIIVNACDQAFSSPDRGAETLMPCDRLEKLDPDEMIVTVDCYHPSGSVKSRLTSDIRTSTLPLLALTVELLASQTLDDLRSNLHCENDFVYICPIKHPKDVKKMDWKKFAGVHDDATTSSAAICINDTVYTADVTPNYGQVLRSWRGQKLLGSRATLKCGSLNTKLKEISFRPGYPYLYRHSDCEHLIVFTNVRRPHPTDPQVPKLYPRLTYFHNLPAIQCRINPKHLAKFVVEDDKRLPEKLVPLCKECCLGFCYTVDINSKEIPFGDFKLYPLVQMQTLPLNDGN